MCSDSDLGLSMDAMHQDLSSLTDSPKRMAIAQSAYFLKEGICIEAKQ